MSNVDKAEFKSEIVRDDHTRVAVISVTVHVDTHIAETTATERAQIAGIRRALLARAYNAHKDIAEG